MENPTVEAEMRHLLPIDYVLARLVSPSPGSFNRLIDYAENALETVQQFGAMPLAAIGFACTASSYLIGSEREEEIAIISPIPFLFAAASIRHHLVSIGARRIALISPYPKELHDRGAAYWRRAGLDIGFEARLDIGSADTRAIYRLSGNEASASIEEARRTRPDAILLAGTGMPTLALIQPDASPPILSSNQCLAAALLARAKETQYAD
jgi:maleate isomerase